MRAKWLFAVLALIVLPVAFLSLMAARTIRNQELILSAELRRQAAQAIRSVDRAVQDQLHNHLEAVTLTLAAALRPDQDAAVLARAAAAVTRRHPLAQQVFVFVNPWGFLYGETGREVDGQFHDGPPADRLRSEITTAAGLYGPVAFREGTAAYCFRGVTGQPNLWVGYRVSLPQAAVLLQEVLSDRAGDGLCLELTGAWPVVIDAGQLEAPGRVVVSDSFSADPAPVAAVAPRNRLAGAALSAPLDFLEVESWPLEPEAIGRLGAMRGRLLTAATILAALSVLTGTGLALYKGHSELREARHRGEYLLGVSHDLRTPLASMRMLAESLAEGRVREQERARFLNTLVRECDRLARLIERVLFLFRYGQGALVYRPGYVDPGDLVREAVADMPAPSREIVERVAAELPRVRGDALALKQVLMNLLDNATKYGVRLGEQGRIEVLADSVRRRRYGLGPERVWVRLRVRDFGPGIARRDRRRIFRKYYRSPQARDRNVSGVGLGLALCRHVVHNHGGSIHVQSLEGRGAEFTVWLPAVQGREAA